MSILGSKACPSCGCRLSIGEFWLWRSAHTTCRDCGQVLSISFGRLVLAAIVSSPLVALPMAAGLSFDAKWWLLLPVGLAAQAIVYYLLFGVTGSSKDSLI